MAGPNLRRLKPTRQKPQAGDVFAMGLPDGQYLFGRVILADLPRERAPMPGSNLIYIYRVRSHSKTPPDPAQLTVDRLLVAPIFINRLPWAKGYFEKVANWPLRRDDLLRQHCFHRWTGQYMDEAGNLLPGRVEPCGEWGLASYRVVDDEVSAALVSPLFRILGDDVT